VGRDLESFYSFVHCISKKKKEKRKKKGAEP
jgi:hypothetical protein